MHFVLAMLQKCSYKGCTDAWRYVMSDQEFVIEKDVPMPSAGGRHRLYPFDQMEVGDSFFAANAKRDRV